MIPAGQTTKNIYRRQELFTLRCIVFLNCLSVDTEIFENVLPSIGLADPGGKIGAKVVPRLACERQP